MPGAVGAATSPGAKAGDARDTSGYPPASRVADAMRWMLDCPPDVCVPELLLEQHRYER